MSVASTRRYFLRRAIERGDPRLGMIVGLLLALLCGAAASTGLTEPLELRVLDVAFQRRPPIRESDKIVYIDIDDLTLRELPWPPPRDAYAQVILALDRLGASQIVFDVQFKSTIPRPGSFDPESGAYLMNDEDRKLHAAIRRSGKVCVAYSFDLQTPLSPALMASYPAIKAAFLKNPLAELDEVARGSGVSPALLREEFERAREQAFVSIVSDTLDGKPDLSFLNLRKAILPNVEVDAQPRALKLLQNAFWMWQSRRAIDAKSLPVAVEGTEWRGRRASGLLPPLYPFLEPAQSVGCVNAEPDSDGVMRRPWTHLSYQDRSFSYLGLEAAARALSAKSGRLGPGVAELRGGTDAVTLPLEADGRLLVNWAGNRWKPRNACFEHLRFGQILSFYEGRYDRSDRSLREMIRGLSDEERQPLHKKYLELSDRLSLALQGKSTLPPEELRAIETKMDEIRARMIADFDSEIAQYDQGIAANSGKDRLIKRLSDLRSNRVAQRDQLVQGFESEAALRGRINGKICFIGSAATASGDLHATPVGSLTPGVDVLANVANMALTGQVIRRAPGWVNFVTLLALGLLVSFYVTHWNATASAVATLATAAGSLGLFWVLFTGPAILVTGAGPLVTALLSFAGVTAYKELVTQRSKRKLQRELEKNTSPALVKILMEHPEFLSQPRKMIGTFFFSDVKSFTSITEKMDAEVLFPFINRYLDRVTQALIGHEAFVDKYIGDGIMALFGIPVPAPHHALNACKAALDCQQVLKSLNAEFAKEGLPEVKMRIGIHSGEVRAGNVGSLYRSNYTVLGDNVNLSARLEGANKEYDTSIMISEATWDLVAEKVAVRELDRIRVVGKRKPVRIYELLGLAGGVLPLDAEFLGAYAAGLAAFKERRWAESIELFQKALASKPGDKPSVTYIERAKVFQIMPPPPDWEGVFELTSK